jgi:serine/threonine-protein kinase RsbW
MVEPEPLPYSASLEIPADHNYVQLARLVASGLAGRLDFNIDEIEDLRIGVDECCVAILDCAAEGSTVRLDYSWDTDVVQLQAKVHGVDGAAPVATGITAQILAAVVDDYRLWRDDDELQFVLRKRRTTSES